MRAAVGHPSRRRLPMRPLAQERRPRVSLFDALFLDPAPFECYVAYRTDSVAGSGSLDDPWNAAPKWAAPSQLSSVTMPGTDHREALATAPGHTFVNGDVVTISGVVSDGADRLNGTFAIYGVSGSQFK